MKKYRWLFFLAAVILLICGLCPAQADQGEAPAEASPSAQARSVLSRLLEMTIAEDEIVRPLNPENRLEMMKLAAVGAWLDSGSYGMERSLYIVFRAETYSPGDLPVFLEQEHPEQIEYNGESILLEQFRGNRDLVSCELMDEHSWFWYDYTDEGLYLIACVMNPDPARLAEASSLSFAYQCENLSTGQRDSGTVVVDLPPMIREE